MKGIINELNVEDIDDIRHLFIIFVQTALDAGLEAELDEEFGYSKDDYPNKETNNSSNSRSNLDGKKDVLGMWGWIQQER